MSKFEERQSTARTKKTTVVRKSRAKSMRRRLSFEATTQHDHVRMQANVPTKWLRLIFKVLVVIVIGLLILKAPELWQAIQAAINLVPK